MQEIYHEGDLIIIICILQDQAKLFQSLCSFKVDMSFKHVHEGRFNKVIFAVFLEGHGKGKYTTSLVLVRD
jgi:hypothetical protein